MYRNFFSLSDLPFSISPDPKYLFMSDRHKEALAHLTYGLGGSGLGENGGFALLTGEVGTGKTTISRCLMEQLPTNTQAAFILNPTLSSRELLATLCDELKIRYRKSDASLKILTDKIAEKLLKNHQNDINTLLIIDEAQHLQPEVLEQLRLLTNLETNTKKLLQVILIGQPELQQLLQRRDLRQLAQRITARYHLMPLTKQELSQYVAHRLSIADCSRTLFNKSAIAIIHQLSDGIPRLINLLCHSALMVAYNQNDSVVDKKIVLKAAEQAFGNEQTKHRNLNGSSLANNVALIVTATLSVVAIISVVALSAFLWEEKATEQPLPVAVITSKVPVTGNNDLARIASVNAESVEIESKASTQEEMIPEGSIPEENTLAETLPKKANSVAAPLDNSSMEQLQISSDKPNMQAFAEQQAIAQKNENNEPKATGGSIQKSVQTAQQPQRKTSLQAESLDEVSDELLTLFQAAVDETELNDNEAVANQSNDVDLALSQDTQQQIKPLTQMPVWVQNGVPSLTFEQHIYSSDGQGWVNVNGRDRYEGDMIGPDLQVSKILPQQVILSYQGNTFSLPALTNW